MCTSKALADPYFNGLAKIEREPSCQPIPKVEFEFERRRVTKEDIKELIFGEILEYHPQLLKEYASGTQRPNFLHLSAADQFREQFTQLEENGGRSGLLVPVQRKHASLPRSTVVHSASISSMDHRHVASSSTKHVVDGSWNTQIHGVHASIAGKLSTTVRPLMFCDSQNSQPMNDPRNLAPTRPWQPNILHLQNQAHFQNPPWRGSLLDATNSAQYMPGTIPSVDSTRPGHLYLYMHQSVTADAVPSDRTNAPAVSASHGPVPAVPYSMQGVYRT